MALPLRCTMMATRMPFDVFGEKCQQGPPIELIPSIEGCSQAQMPACPLDFSSGAKRRATHRIKYRRYRRRGVTPYSPRSWALWIGSKYSVRGKGQARTGGQIQYKRSGTVSNVHANPIDSYASPSVGTSATSGAVPGIQNFGRRNTGSHWNRAFRRARTDR